MEHLHTATNTTYQIGQLFDSDSRSFDINVITKWDEENDYEQSPVLIDYYFGDLDTDVTNYCIDQFIERQQQICKAISYLEKLDTADPELATVINSLKSMLVELH